MLLDSMKNTSDILAEKCSGGNGSSQYYTGLLKLYPYCIMEISRHMN